MPHCAIEKVYSLKRKNWSSALFRTHIKELKIYGYIETGTKTSALWNRSAIKIGIFIGSCDVSGGSHDALADHFCTALFAGSRDRVVAAAQLALSHDTAESRRRKAQSANTRVCARPGERRKDRLRFESGENYTSLNSRLFCSTHSSDFS